MPSKRIRKRPSAFGRDLNKKWRVGALHALYRESGDWYNHLLRFPGALFDRYGYVLFRTEDEYRSSPYLQLGKEIARISHPLVASSLARNLPFIPSTTQTATAYVCRGGLPVLFFLPDFETRFRTKVPSDRCLV